MRVYLNGKYLPKDEAHISVDDRGFIFGDGVYEVTRVIRGKLFAESAHWRRLENGLSQLGIRPPAGFTMEAVRTISERLLNDNGLADADATVYLQVTRGAAPRVHVFPPPETPATVFISVSPMQIPWELRKQGVKVVTQPDLRWARCDLKTVNLLPNVLARQRAKEAGGWEALLVRDGVVTEGAATTAFAVVDGQLWTHPSGHRILPGVTRDIVLKLASELGFRVHEAPFRLDERHRWQELFLTGTTTDVQAVVDVDGAPVGDGRPGPVSRALQAALYHGMGVSSLAEPG
ncbi:MAG: D-amino acid aminotransferase [Myxococcaceae bacterium]|nr:D-amino acid aminotransferase [Myxococcaceae bacterium]